jgi:Family of unknown function (DUF6328)
MATRSSPEEKREKLPLSKAAEYLLDECRMVLPGIQALFGFQLIAVFNSTFKESLSSSEQRLHLLAIALVAIAVAIIMTPAALHRQKGPYEVTDLFVRVSSRLLLWSMGPLALSISIDFYLVSRIVTNSTWVALLATSLFVLFVVLWFVLPRARGVQQAIVGQSRTSGVEIMERAIRDVRDRSK